MRTRQLPNGMSVVLLPIASVPTVDIRMVFRSGGADEPADATGAALVAGHGLTWNLPKVLPIADLQRIEVWNHRAILSDTQLDRITLDRASWSFDGQRFHIDLLGRRNVPPNWTLPMIAVGATISLMAFLKFVWDQVI